MQHWPERVERVLKAEGDSQVVLLRLGERRVVLKLMLMRGWVARTRCWLGITRHHRKWRGAELLQTARIPTSKPVAMGTIHALDKEGNLTRGQWLVLAYLQGPTLLDVFRDAQRLPHKHRLKRQGVLATKAGESVRSLVRAGLMNRDHKPSNLIVLRSDPRNVYVSLGIIDTVGIRRIPGGNWRHSATARMLASLIIEAIGCGVYPNLRSRHIAVRAATGAWEPWLSIRRVWRGVRRIVESHGDPTPKVNPLGAADNQSAPPNQA